MKKIAAVILSLLFCMPVWAKSMFEILVPVNVEAQNSVEAKDKAMAEAQRTGFLTAAAKLTAPENVERLKELTDNEILYFVQSVSVANEKAGGTKYIADLTVQINEPLLRDYLAENEMIKTEAKTLLVVPVYKARPNSLPLLWENDNLWRQNWEAKGLIFFGTMQMRTTTERFQQIADFTAENALYMGASLYDEIVAKGGVEDIFVVYAERTLNNDLKITVRDEKNKKENSFSVYNEGEENTLFDRAIEKTVMFVSNMERETESMDGVETNGSVNVVYTYTSMKDWLARSEAISRLPQVSELETKSFGGGKVNFSINYTGSLEDLWTALQELGLSHEAVGNYYIIR